MLENQRLAYLEALGIPQFVPRAELEGAPVLPLLEPDQIWSVASEQDPNVITDAEIGDRSETVEQLESIAESVASAEQVETVAPQAEKKPQPDADESVPVLDLSRLGLLEKADNSPARSSKAVQSAQTSNEIRFALAIVDVSEQFRVVVELMLADAPGLSAMEHRMLSDLLQLFGQGEWLSNHGPRTFQWPIVNNPRIAKDRAAARDGLMGFFGSTAPMPKTLFLGSQAPSLLQQREMDPLKETSAPLNIDGLVGAALVLPSLSQMQDWTLKQRSWLQIHAFLS